MKLADGDGNTGSIASLSTGGEMEFRERKLRYYLQCYPLALTGMRFREVLHDSDNAVIFRAECDDGVTVAVKRFKFDATRIDNAVLDDFLLESRALGLLEQRSLVRLLDAGMASKAIYLVMEYVSGDSLKHYLDADPLPSMRQRLAWFAELAEAVGEVHSLCLIHRDLKPSNILVRADNTLALLDFGMETRFLVEAGFLHKDEVYCTPYYISPERVMGEPADVASDFYALGVILYELLTGHRPYESRNLEELLKKHVLAPIPVLPDNLRAYQPLLNGLLAKFSNNRIKSTDEVVRLLRKAQPEQWIITESKQMKTGRTWNA